ncbi:acyl carrier protein [Kitasatospora sp. NPDC057015]|uniref:acyl carrier protein n=1 Tax=Kitasatospora sp. NPDC057015 TaxID=3346001 RepID=UPI00362DE36A
MSSDRATAATAEPLVLEVVAQVLDLDEEELAPELALPDLPGWDSVNAMRVLVLLERAAGEALDFDGFSGARTLAELAAVAADAFGSAR